MEIKTNTIDGRTYYAFEVKRVSYTMYFDTTLNAWGLYSKRKGMSTFGQHRYFKTLDAVESKIKSLFGLSALLNPEHMTVLA
jgi:hypothetical protein